MPRARSRTNRNSAPRTPFPESPSAPVAAPGPRPRSGLVTRPGDVVRRPPEPITGFRRTVRVAPGKASHWPWLWAVAIGAVLLAGFGAVAGGFWPAARPGGVWSEIAGQMGGELWRSFGRVSAVVWGYYGLFAGAGFALGSMALDDSMPSRRRWTLAITAVLAAPLGRVVLEWLGARLFLDRAPHADEFVFLLFPALGIAALVTAFAAVLPSAFEPTAMDFGGRFDRFGPGADQAQQANFQGVLLLGGFLVVSIFGLVLVI